MYNTDIQTSAMSQRGRAKQKAYFCTIECRLPAGTEPSRRRYVTLGKCSLEKGGHCTHTEIVISTTFEIS